MPVTSRLTEVKYMSDVYFGKGGKTHPNKKRQILQGDQKRNLNMIRNYELYSVLKLNLKCLY